ncbi:tetratricopeptide repeat protein [Aromatoleum evansii]|uniref:Tetratricopeptide repeat protein n=1 Tax=Aromatoleum evansii TaxID=59406 RepID=A0ABZ1ALI4_AROEV|nr:tetratricopeptide repeat protein [Aromatoleum evansii]NMG30706.1 sel1 repeat family protein [Aromatoleum evansii]WRL46724.1 tetratricopeptide repeat protein [Aromatoleum evansii]
MKSLGTGNLVLTFRQLFATCALLVASSVAYGSSEDDYKKGLAAYDAGDLVGAMVPLKQAADEGHAGAQALYGTILDSAELDDQAVLYLRKSADQQNSEGQYGLAKMFMTGEGVTADFGEANKLMRAAAAQGHRSAIITLGLAYIAGDARFEASDKTSPEARDFILKAGEFGELTAVEAVARAYREGAFGIAPDSAKAKEWDEKLAKIRGAQRKKGDRR